MTIAVITLYLAYGLYSFWPLIHKEGLYDTRVKWHEWAMAWFMWCFCWPYRYIMNAWYWWRATK